MTPKPERERFAHGVLWAGPFDGERVRFVTGPGQAAPLTYRKIVSDWRSRLAGLRGRPVAPVAVYTLRPGPELDSTGAMIYDYQGQETK